MKNKILTAAVIALVALTTLPFEASAAGTRNPKPTIQQNQLFARLNAQLRALRPGDARAIALARRMINLIPEAAPQVLAVATTKVVTTLAAERLVRVSIQVISSFRIPDTEMSSLLVRSVNTVVVVAESIPRIVATSPKGTQQSTGDAIRGIAVETILADPNLDSVVENTAIPEIQPTPVPTPTPVPYGA